MKREPEKGEGKKKKILQPIFVSVTMCVHSHVQNLPNQLADPCSFLTMRAALA